MPFIERRIEPKYLSRTCLRNPDGSFKIKDDELQAVTNNTLSNALKQLASLVFLANDIFTELSTQLKDVAERSLSLQTRIVNVGDRVESFDPKTVPVPEGSLSNFASRKVHYTAKHPQHSELFTPATRPQCITDLYENATKQPLHVTCLEDLRRDIVSSPFLICTPVLGSRNRRALKGIDIDIETRKPAAVRDLRKWTSKEAIGEVSALTDASVRVTSCVTLTPDQLSEVDSGDEANLDHQLPSPEEQLEMIISKFAPQLVPIDTTGRFFDRMCNSRKSLIHFDSRGETDTVKRRGRSRKPRGKRRNTISGTDQKELREAIAGESSNASAPQEVLRPEIPARSKSGDLLSASPPELAITTKKPGHFDSLKRWSRIKLRSIGKSNTEKCIKPDEIPNNTKENDKDLIDDSPPKSNVAANRKRRSLVRTHERTPSHSSSDAAPIPVRLRDRRLRKAKPEDEPHSSSGNWSASSESGRTSLASDARTKHPDASSEGTLTPEVAHDDLETGSEYSCDTEGYYTSFHVDSGLKTLREEEPYPKAKQETDYELFGRGSTSTTASSAGTVCTIRAASERDLSAPTPPERASSLIENKSRSLFENKSFNASDSIRAFIAGRENFNRRKTDDINVKTIIEEKGKTSPILDSQGRYSSSPDSGHNTSSSPIDDSVSSAAGKQSPSERDYSSCSDLEGADRTERIRTKVAIDSSRIPSMCVITPAASDDEGSVRSVAPLPMPLKAPTLVPLANIVGKLKGVFPQRLSKRISPLRPPAHIPELEFDPGEYVTIADVENNNKQTNTYDVCKNLRAILSGDPETEYVSLNELPDVTDGALGSRTSLTKIGAKVTLNSEGKVVYSSDSLRRRHGAHTTFEPGPYVNVVSPSSKIDDYTEPKAPLSPQMKKIIIKAPISPFERTTSDVVNIPASKPSTIITPIYSKTVARVTPNLQRPIGAYVNIQEAEGVSLSPSKDENKDSRYAVADAVPKATSVYETRTQIQPQQINPHPCSQDNAFSRVNPMFWSLNPAKVSSNMNSQRAPTPDLDSPLRTFISSINRPIIKQPIRLQSALSPRNTESNEESLKISPIDPRHSGDFKSSTPSKDNTINLGKVLSPTKSTMSAEELYAVIHKSKKKLNIKDPADRCGSPALSTLSLSPVSSESSLVGKIQPVKPPESGYLTDPMLRPQQFSIDRANSPQSYPRSSSCSDRLGPIPQTSRLDFKRLLLQHGIKLNPVSRQNTNKISAVEQLKLSREKNKQSPLAVNNVSQVNILDLSGSPKMYNQRKFVRNQPSSPNRNQTNNKSTPKLVLSPKSQWRFASPRSDVLSTPIPEANNEEDTSNSSSSDKNDSSHSCTVTINTGQHFGARRTLIPIDESVIEADIEDINKINTNPFRESTPNSGESLSRAELQAKRAQFFSSPPDKSPPAFTSFRNPFQRSPTSQSPVCSSIGARNSPSPPALETAL